MQEPCDARPRLIVGIGGGTRASMHPLVYIGARFQTQLLDARSGVILWLR